MKKLITLIAMLAIAGIASADFADGDFSAQSIIAVSSIGNGDTAYDYGSSGPGEYDDDIQWMQSDASWTTVASGGQSGGYANLAGAGRAMAQTWTDSATYTGTDYTLEFWVYVDVATTDGELNVNVVGLGDPWATVSWRSEIALRNEGLAAQVFPLATDHASESGVIVGTRTVDVTGAMGWTKFTLDLDFASGYEFVGVSFGGGVGTGGGNIGIDSVQIVGGASATQGSVFIVK